MCEGAGVFRDMKAAQIAGELCHYVHKEMMPRPKKFKDSFLFFVKQMPLGALMYSFEYAFQSFIMWLGFQLFYPLPYIKCVGIFIVLRMIRSGVVTLKSDKAYDFLKMRNKKLTVAAMRDLEKKLVAGEISYCKMIELINERFEEK